MGGTIRLARIDGICLGWASGRAGPAGCPRGSPGGHKSVGQNRWNLFGLGILQEGARGPQEGPKSAGQNRPSLLALGIRPGRAGPGRAGPGRAGPGRVGNVSRINYRAASRQ